MRRLRITEFAALVDRRSKDLGYTQDEVQRRSGMSRGTYYDKKKHPERLTIAEFRTIAAFLHFTDKDKLDFLEGAIRGRN